MRPNFEDFRPLTQEDIIFMAKKKDMTVKNYLDDLYARWIIDKNTRSLKKICYDDLPECEQDRWREMAYFKGMCLHEYQEYRDMVSDKHEIMSLPSKDRVADENDMTIPEYRDYIGEIRRKGAESEKEKTA